MGKRSTVTGYWRQHGDTTRVAAAGVVPCVLAIHGLDATLSGAGLLTGKVLPKGAIPLKVEWVGAATGGTSPLLDVGLELSTPNDDALLDGADHTGNGSISLGGIEAGVALGVEQTEAAEITISDGGGTNATGGTFDLYIWYTFADDGKVND